MDGANTGRVAVRPVAAASLLLIRDAAGEPEILMGRRVPRHAFAPDVWVFPGGKVAPGDRVARPASPLDPTAEAALGRHGRSFALAAIRETFEETGLALALPGSPGAAPGWEAFAAAGLAPDLAPVRFIARAITPTTSPMRFHARFFLARADTLHGELMSSGELDPLAWLPLSDARRLPLWDVTEFVLGEAERRLAGGAGPVPLYSYRGEVPVVRRPVR
jgi:8-oxo-dGTP pyrophosphatase MutT (NUDIX family)